MNISCKFLMIVAFATTLVFAEQSSNSPSAAKTATQKNAPTLQKVESPKADSTQKVKNAPSAKIDSAKVVKQANAIADSVKPVQNVAVEQKEVKTNAPVKEAPAQKDSVKAAKDSNVKADSNKITKIRGKITYQDYQARVKHTADSILSENYHHGVTGAPAVYHDKSYGNTIRDAVWGGGLGLYYFYRQYFLSTFAIQGRAGFIYRYANFKSDKIVEEGSFKIGEDYKLNRHFNLSYNNISFDLPISAKLGGHIEPTTFMYFSLTFGLTKPLYERVTSVSTLDFEKKSKNIEIIQNEGKNAFPLIETHEINKPFYIDDWETNGWIGVGIDGKYISFEGQILVASGSTTQENHRYYHIGHDKNPTFRFFIDFSMR